MTDKQFTLATHGFEAARHVDILPVGHRSRRLHGHSFQAQVRAALPAQWANFAGAETAALRERLAQCIAPLDYSLLNDRLAVPTDENLARWVHSQLDVPGIQTIGIQSTRNQGVDLDENGHAHIWRRFRFEAAHQLPKVPASHQCGRMHGHGFEVILHADQDLAEQDMGVDFDHLAACWQPLHAQLDHNCLNNISGLENPTSEVLAAWIWDRVQPTLTQLSWVTVYETATAGCHYSADTYRIWKEQSFESALKLKGAPDSDRRHNLHGHSYVLRLHLSAPLDDVMGWTVDYGDVKEIFKPVYEQMDHHRLDHLDALEDGNAFAVLHWIRDQMTAQLPQLDRIDLFETPGCGALLSWGPDAPALPA